MALMLSIACPRSAIFRREYPTADNTHERLFHRPIALTCTRLLAVGEPDIDHKYDALILYIIVHKQFSLGFFDHKRDECFFRRRPTGPPRVHARSLPRQPRGSLGVGGERKPCQARSLLDCELAARLWEVDPGGLSPTNDAPANKPCLRNPPHTHAFAWRDFPTETTCQQHLG
jgi:hypothetical protein